MSADERAGRSQKQPWPGEQERGVFDVMPSRSPDESCPGRIKLSDDDDVIPAASLDNRQEL